MIKGDHVALQWTVWKLGGRIYARNVPDRGCLFTIGLPRLGAAIATC
jgi:hypothetical protein